MKLLEMNNIERYYKTPAGTVKALDGISLEIYEGERVILLGPSGSGKTTLLNCLSALDSPTDGSYMFQDVEVPRNHSEKMTSFRRENIGYVFQFFNLLQDLTVLENILLIQELAGKKDAVRAKELLELVGLEAEVDRFPGEISGGQQQRVAIARSIAKRPTLLLGDELTGNLDTETSNFVEPFNLMISGSRLSEKNEEEELFFSSAIKSLLAPLETHLGPRFFISIAALLLILNPLLLIFLPSTKT